MDKGFEIKITDSGMIKFQFVGFPYHFVKKSNKEYSRILHWLRKSVKATGLLDCNKKPKKVDIKSFEFLPGQNYYVNHYYSNMDIHCGNGFVSKEGRTAYDFEASCPHDEILKLQEILKEML
jgi:hypothetical protein